MTFGGSLLQDMKLLTFAGSALLQDLKLMTFAGYALIHDLTFPKRQSFGHDQIESICRRQFECC